MTANDCWRSNCTGRTVWFATSWPGSTGLSPPSGHTAAVRCKTFRWPISPRTNTVIIKILFSAAVSDSGARACFCFCCRSVLFSSHRFEFRTPTIGCFACAFVERLFPGPTSGSVSRRVAPGCCSQRWPDATTTAEVSI
jgi:hypothetical protein